MVSINEVVCHKKNTGSHTVPMQGAGCPLESTISWVGARFAHVTLFPVRLCGESSFDAHVASNSVNVDAWSAHIDST